MGYLEQYIEDTNLAILLITVDLSHKRYLFSEFFGNEAKRQKEAIDSMHNKYPNSNVTIWCWKKHGALLRQPTYFQFSIEPQPPPNIPFGLAVAEGTPTHWYMQIHHSLVALWDYLNECRLETPEGDITIPTIPKTFNKQLKYLESSCKTIATREYSEGEQVDAYRGE